MKMKNLENLETISHEFTISESPSELQDQEEDTFSWVASTCTNDSLDIKYATNSECRTGVRGGRRRPIHGPSAGKLTSEPTPTPTPTSSKMGKQPPRRRKAAPSISTIFRKQRQIPCDSIHILKQTEGDLGDMSLSLRSVVTVDSATLMDDDIHVKESIPSTSSKWETETDEEDSDHDETDHEEEEKEDGNEEDDNFSWICTVSHDSLDVNYSNDACFRLKNMTTTRRGGRRPTSKIVVNNDADAAVGEEGFDHHEEDASSIFSANLNDETKQFTSSSESTDDNVNGGLETQAQAE